MPGDVSTYHAAFSLLSCAHSTFNQIAREVDETRARQSDRVREEGESFNSCLNLRTQVPPSLLERSPEISGALLKSQSQAIEMCMSDVPFLNPSLLRCAAVD